MPVIHWFRRDLRITDNPSLAAACTHGGAVAPVFVVSDWKGEHRWTGPARQEFLCGCLDSLARNLAAIGGRLIVRRGVAVEELEKIAMETKAGAIYFNRCPDPFGRQMEKRVEKMALLRGLKVHVFKDAAIHERDEIITSTGGPYRVFTPYARVWMQAEKQAAQAAVRNIRTPQTIKSLLLPTLADWGLESRQKFRRQGKKPRERG